MAPRTLPMPPMTAATNALSPSRTQVASAGCLSPGTSGRRGGRRRAASAEPMTKVNEMTASTWMPISAGDVCVSNETARIARPSLVRKTSHCSGHHQRQRATTTTITSTSVDVHAGDA